MTTSISISRKLDENESLIKERAKRKKNINQQNFYIYVCSLSDRQTKIYLENHWTNESSEKEIRFLSYILAEK